MSAATDPLEQERRRLARNLDEVARLCETTVPPSTFYGELLKRVLESLAAPAGIVWARTSQGNLQQQFQVNVKEIGLDRSEEARKAHEELLRLAVMQPRPMSLPPQSFTGPREEGKPVAGNPTDYLLLIVPILNNGEVTGLVEVWQGPRRPTTAVPGFLQYMNLMADLATRYQRNQTMGQLAGQQQLWTQLEAFARQIHGSLNPTEVAYLVANEGRRLVDCDRVSVAVREARRVHVVAVSGADVVEKRSNLVKLMRALAERVVQWGEKLVFSGTKDDSLPPDVLHALDDYLAESGSKLLVVQPLRDDREGDAKSKDRRPPRSVLLMECFDPPAEPQQLIARLDVLGKHACTALYNAVEHKRIPMRFVWAPLARLQEGLGGKAKAITALVVTLVSLLVSALVLLPYPLKMDATGQLQPQVRRVVSVPAPGTILEFTVEPNSVVEERRALARMFDITQQSKINLLLAEERAAETEAAELDSMAKMPDASTAEKNSYRIKADLQRNTRDSKLREIRELLARTGGVPGRPGFFTLTAPPFFPEEANLLRRREWTVLTGSFREEWTGREARPNEPILRLGALDGPWEIELKIPQKHIGQVLRAYERLKTDVLEVDFLLRSDPTRVFKARLDRGRIAGEATPGRDEKDEAEPVVLAFVRIDDPSIAADDRLPPELLLAGTEVHAKVRCGSHKMGYSLFYGVWEFLYEKVVFWF